MGFFNKNSAGEENTTPRNPNNTIMFRLLAVGYVTYLCINMIKLYVEGGPEAPSLPVLIGGVALLGGGALFLGILSYKEWKRNKVTYEEAMAKLRAEAEAKRAAEEAMDAEDDFEDDLILLPEEAPETDE